MTVQVKRKVLLVVVAIFVAFCSLYKLTQSPPTWVDEGNVIQVSHNLAQEGKYAVRIAPDQFVSAGFITTGPTVIIPAAFALYIFESSLFAARAVIILYIFLLVIVGYLLVRMLWPGKELWSLALLVTFSPLYGLGRNVLGDIPGLALLVIALHLTKEKRYWPWAGLFFGLMMITKPIFLLFAAPALLIALYVHRHELPEFKYLGFSLCAGLVPIIFLILIQYHGDSLSGIVSMYMGNPENTTLLTTVWSNMVKIFTEPQVLYAFLLFLATTIGYVVRRRKGLTITFAETVLVLCVILDMAAYFKSRGYYRYFAPAEILAILYLPEVLSQLVSSKISRLILVSLIIFQTYQTIFVSWIPEHYSSQKNVVIAKEMSLAEGGPVLFWQTTELVPFYQKPDYYQYIVFTDSFIRGEEVSLQALRDHVAQTVLVRTGVESQNFKFDGYSEERTFDGYTVFKRDK